MISNSRTWKFFRYQSIFPKSTLNSRHLFILHVYPGKLSEDFFFSEPQRFFRFSYGFEKFLSLIDLRGSARKTSISLLT